VIYPHSELRFVTPAIGYGVFATKRIPKGTITWVRCSFDKTMSPREVAALDPFYAPIIDKYAFVDGRGDYVLCWDHARYMNHSCAPSCLSPGLELDIAVRDIEVGEELTCDYATLNIERPFECRCGRTECRKVIRPNDWELLARGWDTQIKAAFARLEETDQPLWSLVQDKDGVRASARGERLIPPSTAHFGADAR
jgi:uncharacterized protein